MPQKKAQELGYQQNLWVLGDTVTEVGQMNLFVVYRDEASVIHLITPPLNGQILPGVTRDSLLRLARSHAQSPVVGLPEGLVVEEREFTLTDLSAWSAGGNLLECFGAGTAAVVAPVCRIGIPQGEGVIRDLEIPVGVNGLGPVAEGLHRRLAGIQTGEVEGPDGWKVVCP